jgi:hypothetical protein
MDGEGGLSECVRCRSLESNRVTLLLDGRLTGLQVHGWSLRSERVCWLLDGGGGGWHVDGWCVRAGVCSGVARIRLLLSRGVVD